jgi:hypothetical protein
MKLKPGDLVNIRSSSQPHNWIPGWDLATKQVTLLRPHSLAVLVGFMPGPMGEMGESRCQILMEGCMYETYQDYLEEVK